MQIVDFFFVNENMIMLGGIWPLEKNKKMTWILKTKLNIFWLQIYYK